MEKIPKKKPRRIGFLGRDGYHYSFTRVNKDGVEGVLIDRADPNDSSAIPDSFFVPKTELEDLIDALIAFLPGEE